MLRKVIHQDKGQRTKDKVKDLLLCISSAGLLAFSFPSFNIWILSWFGFVPLFLAIKGKSRARAFLLSYATGILFWAGIIYWLIHVTLPGLIILVLYLAFYFGIFGTFFSTYCVVLSPYNLLFIPSVWVCLEYIRGWLFTGFPWALLGYSQYLNLPVIQMADITGVWGVSFLVMFANVAVVEIVWTAKNKFRQRLKKTFLALLFVLALILSYGYIRLHELRAISHEGAINISVIQANIPQELKWEPSARAMIMDKYLSMSSQALKDGPGLIVWPEAAVPAVIEDQPYYFEEARLFARDKRINLLLGAVRNINERYYNNAIFLSGRLGPVSEYSKIHLVPFGEYIPLRRIFPFLEAVVPIGDFSPGKDYTVFRLGAVGFSVLICFEDLFPGLSERFVNKGAGFLVVITNDAWFGRTSSAYQHFSASVFRAVENRVPVVRAANTGVSGFISRDGRIIYSSGIFVDDYATGKIEINAPRKTLYGRFPDGFVFICFLFTLYGIISFQKNKK